MPRDCESDSTSLSKENANELDLHKQPLCHRQKRNFETVIHRLTGMRRECANQQAFATWTDLIDERLEKTIGIGLRRTLS